MRTIGIIGGSTWISTIDYYKYFNMYVNERLGGYHTAKILMYSFNFNFLKIRIDAGEWELIADRIVKEAKILIHAGADCIVLAANTLHFVADEVSRNISAPLIHIGDAVGKEIHAQGLQRVALLGTSFTMEKNFIHNRLGNYNISAVIPDSEDRKVLHDIIYNELALNKFSPQAKNDLQSIINRLQEREIQGMILGCTELPQVLGDLNIKVPVFDSTKIHALDVVNYIFNEM